MIVFFHKVIGLSLGKSFVYGIISDILIAGLLIKLIRLIGGV
jgi:hypothetical protein